MAFQVPITIKEAIENIHRKKYLLPAIQREFVWNEEQIEWLFDSLMRDFPVGSFLFWYVQKENSKEFKFYEFLRDFHEKNNRHNMEADISGEEDLIAILDGQQRLTSLYIGLKGSYAAKLPNKRRDSEASYPKKELYVNLLKPSEEIDWEYQFEFLTADQAKVRNATTFWFRVGDILDMKEHHEVNDFLLENELTLYEKEAAKFANRTLFKLHKVIHETPCINFYLEKGKELDKVLQIFIRVNSGGTPLSYSDLLLSIATAQWKEKDARETITAFVDELNEIGDTFYFDKDLILKTCLVLCDFTDIAFKVDNFNSSNMKKIEQEWDKIEQSIRLAVELVASFGFNYKTLTATYVIIPIAYYLYKKDNPKNYVKSVSTIEDRRNIQKFTTVALLKKLFGGQPDTVLRPIREIIKNQHSAFPFDQIKDGLRVTNKSLKMDEDEINDLLYTKYGNKYAFSILSLLYPTLDYTNHFHQDHIYPRSLLKSGAKLKKRGLDDDAIAYCMEKYDYIGNLQLIEGVPNQQKSDMDIDAWLDTVCKSAQEKADYRKKHLLPDLPLTLDNFEQFLEKREELIVERLKEVLLG
ncbi:DUF262 domain-containing protein [Brevibacillus fulvus]|uniref:Uncharacterized protein with ParB-like and HNH nuclease domain n=1 Tax=Brevibacillus fulvus TaxID=1125967 RepID=A0A938XWD4_9BACL|nr:DUF262 domain-containing protein [Brevibacillus fulvus]MBM7591713.1 uncharacterized protein with ParB-like and HNH nuclease domain [Brevibacillus fulvus]